MAGHSKYANIKHRKGAQDSQRTKVFTKLARRISAEAKAGADLNDNYRLRCVVDIAKRHNMPKDKIQTAINKGANLTEGDQYESMNYECYAPYGVAMIIHALTDNRNRTASELRSVLGKFKGNIAGAGSTTYLFEQVGLITYHLEDREAQEKISSISMSNGALDVTPVDLDNGMRVMTFVDNLQEVSDALVEAVGPPEESRLAWVPLQKVQVGESQAETLHKMIDALDDLDDVQYLDHNADI